MPTCPASRSGRSPAASAYYLYPANEPYLPQDELEKIALFGVEVDMRYDPVYDREALVFDLEPGEMLTWPLNAPHRVENYDVLNDLGDYRALDRRDPPLADGDDGERHPAPAFRHAPKPAALLRARPSGPRRRCRPAGAAVPG